MRPWWLFNSRFPDWMNYTLYWVLYCKRNFHICTFPLHVHNCHYLFLVESEKESKSTTIKKEANIPKDTVISSYDIFNLDPIDDFCLKRCFCYKYLKLCRYSLPWNCLVLHMQRIVKRLVSLVSLSECYMSEWGIITVCAKNILK